jgi:hypothetical protein
VLVVALACLAATLLLGRSAARAAL